MPIDYEFDAEHDALCVRLFGVVSDGDLLQYAEAITSDRSSDPKHNELIDLRDVEEPIASTDTLRRVAAIFRKSEREPESVKVAFIATSDAAYGLARMYQSLRAESATKMQVFRDANDARDWLGLEPE